MLRSVSAAIQALREVLANADIRWAQLAWMLGYAGDWAWQVALFVYAFDAGGVAAVGLVGVIRTVPAGVLAPVLTSVIDRLPRHRVLLVVDAARALVIGLAAVSVAFGWPTWVVFALAPLDGLLAVMHRPTFMALLPSVARSPEELVAANAASATMEGVGTLIGPVVGGALVALATVPMTFAAPAAILGMAVLTLLGVHPATLRPASRVLRLGRTRLMGGLRAVIDHRHAALLLGVFSSQILVRGILNVLLVATSIELLGMGEEGVGTLNAAIGAGGLLGALWAMTLVARQRLAAFVSLGLALWGLPILVIGVVPQPAVAVTVLLILGAGNAVLDVSGFSLLQRSVPNDVRGAVFGVLESLVMLGIGVGSALAPALVLGLGLRGALVASGLLLPLVALLSWAAVRRTDAAAVIPAREMAIMRGVPMFRLLPLTVLEQVAVDAAERRFAEGEQLIVQGQAGDSFFVLAEGSALAAVDGSEVNRLGPGDFFGEIALLRHVPRTATVTATSDGLAYVVTRDAFVSAVTGDRRSMAAADEVISAHLRPA